MSIRRVADWAIVGLAIVVVGLLVFPKFVGAGDRSRRSPISEMSSIKSTLAHFKLDCGRYPITAEGLRALRVPPQDVKDQWGPDAYADRDVSNDLFGHPYEYQSDGHSYTLTCYSEDGQPGGEGYNADIVVQSD